MLATFDGDEVLLGPGDFAWAGVGCVHSFAATGVEVRWLETQAPPDAGTARIPLRARLGLPRREAPGRGLIAARIRDLTALQTIALLIPQAVA